MDASITRRICLVISSVLDVPAAALGATTEQKSIAGWDSLGHIHLVLGLETEFGVSFTVEQALTLTSVPAIYAALSALERRDAR